VPLVRLVVILTCGAACRQPPDDPILDGSLPGPAIPAGAIRVSDEGSPAAACAALVAAANGSLTIAWTTTAVGAIRRVFTNQLGRDGRRVGPDQRVTWFASEVGGCPAVSGSGDHVALAWSSPQGINLANLDASGTLVGAPSIVVPTTGGLGVSLAFDGSGYGLVWEEGRTSVPDREIRFVRLDLDGIPTGPPRVLVPRGEGGEGPTIVAVSTGFAVAWYAAGVLLQRLAADGSPIGEPTSERGTGAGEPSLQFSPPVASASNSSKLGLAWRYRPENDSQVRFHVTQRDAPELGETRPTSITTRVYGRAMFAAASTDGFLVAWTSLPLFHIDSIAFPGSRLQFIRLDSAGQPIPPLDAIDGDVQARAAGFDGKQYVLALTTSDGGLYVLKVDP